MSASRGRVTAVAEIYPNFLWYCVNAAAVTATGVLLLSVIEMWIDFSFNVGEAV